MRGGYKYSAEFKSVVAREVVEQGKRCIDVATRYNIGSALVSEWAQDYKMEKASDSPENDEKIIQQSIPYRRSFGIPSHDFTPTFKAQVALEALMGDVTEKVMAKKYKISRTSIVNWKLLLKNALIQILEKAGKDEDDDPTPVIEAMPVPSIVEDKGFDKEALKEAVRKLLEGI